METEEDKRKRHKALLDSLGPRAREKLLLYERMQKMSPEEYKEYQKEEQRKIENLNKVKFTNPFEKARETYKNPDLT